MAAAILAVVAIVVVIIAIRGAAQLVVECGLLSSNPSSATFSCDLGQTKLLRVSISFV